MRNRLITAILLLTCLLTAALPAADAVRGVEAEFTQIRRMKELGMEITFKGLMRCEPGKRLKWVVREPVASVTLIEADKLTHFDAANKKTSVIDAGKLPFMKLLHTCFSGWVSGDQATLGELEKNFDIRRQNPHHLQLTPKIAAAKSWMLQVEIFFAPGKSSSSAVAHTAVEKVIVTEASGDITEIRFHAVKHNPFWSETAWGLDLK